MEELFESQLKTEMDEIFDRINKIINNFEKHDPFNVDENKEKENNIDQIKEV